MSSRFRYLLLSILAGILLWLAWPSSPGTVFIFVALTPLLWLADQVKNKKAYWAWMLLAFTIFNVGTTWWVGNTTVPASGVFANLFTALLMTIPFTSFYGVRKRLGRNWGYVALVVYWMTFEYVNLTWEFAWPWLSLGNAMAMHPDWVQWYEFTGVGGGTLWILVVNIMLYECWRGLPEIDMKYLKPILGRLWKPAVVLFVVPFVVNMAATFKYTPPVKASGVEVVIVQPNVDPYGKFGPNEEDDQLNNLLQLSAQQVTPNTRYIIWPETAILNGQIAEESTLPFNPVVQRIVAFLKQHAPGAKLVTGATTWKLYPPNAVDVPYTAQQLPPDGIRGDYFNAAIQVDTAGQVQAYHKSKLVPGVEIIPYVRYLPFMSTFALDMGGAAGGCGLTPGVTLMTGRVKLPGTSAGQKAAVAPVVCYESVFGEYMARQVREGADFLVIMTNDGWWGNTEGYRQHFNYARLRAIETRHWIARSANTGISAFISPKGEVVDPQPYWKAAVIKNNVTFSNTRTLYVRWGDYLYKAAAIFCILLIIYRSYLRFTKRPVYVEEHQPKQSKRSVLG
ncbi:apolipoprotein N-acyltransferase [Chitinophaga parva]|uniref:Apolipoprotein N-acyltransferase n=1 Tax=Chitinophaga parva TaxID=2169414 RepID=A0A2T7BNI5_9BACT|nr:apolipoprotein N-acyltransferase [Chitinophaga parva]PUZ29238.1 apolipoprotein N-acyltransferase [Chitinophaga parva]